jgi:hypothetical protein
MLIYFILETALYLPSVLEFFGLDPIHALIGHVVLSLMKKRCEVMDMQSKK